MLRRRFLMLAPLAGLAPLVGCSSSVPQWPEVRGPKVLVTFAPYWCFVSNVIGDLGTVKSLLSTQGPHHADTSVAERTLVERADLMFINGLGLDNRFARKLRKDSTNRKLELIDLGAKLPKAQLLQGECLHGAEDGHDHDHGDHDPHVWLCPDLASRMVIQIRDELMKAAPEFAVEYKANAAAYLDRLAKLRAEGAALLKDRKDRKIVTVHESLGYFARSFDLTIAGVIQKAPGQEPNPAQQKELSVKCRKENVRVIAVEPQYASRKSAEALKRDLVESGIADPQVIELNTLETATSDELTPDWYERGIRKNIEELARVLK